MTRNTLILREDQIAALREHFAASDGHEAVGYMHCGLSNIASDAWDGQPQRKYLAREFDPVPKESLKSASKQHVTWPTDSLILGLRRSREKNEVLSIFHSHPGGYDSFSKQDDENEADLIDLIKRRNGPTAEMLSVLLLPDGRMFGRVWTSPSEFHRLDLIIVIGRRISLHYSGRGRGNPVAFLNRQALALGECFNDDVAQLRIGVVGCGGTGSAISMLLPRLGIRHIALIDADPVDETNLNRLHFATSMDAEQRRLKVHVLKRGIEELKLGVKVSAFTDWISHSRCYEALKSCDIIFGCTDDNSGRMLLNRFAYFYYTPVIDMGLAIEVDRGDPPRIRALDGRVTVLQPGNTCLLCRGIVDARRAYAESLRRLDEAEYNRQKEEAYVVGEGNPSPAVVTFTTGVAVMALEELIHRLQGFRGEGGAVDQRLRQFHRSTDRRLGHQSEAQCPICCSREYWGKGDTTPFLDSIS